MNIEPMLPVALALSYALGSLPTGLWLGLSIRGIDIRQKGSKNIRATNTMRVVGNKLGALAPSGDIAKGVLATLLVARLADWEHAPLACGTAAILGHTFSLFLKFRGGKGVATSAGAGPRARSPHRAAAARGPGRPSRSGRGRPVAAGPDRHCAPPRTVGRPSATAPPGPQRSGPCSAPSRSGSRPAPAPATSLGRSWSFDPRARCSVQGRQHRPTFPPIHNARRFCGFDVLPLFVAYDVVRGDGARRRAILSAYSARLRGLARDEPLAFHGLDGYDRTGRLKAGVEPRTAAQRPGLDKTRR